MQVKLPIHGEPDCLVDLLTEALDGTDMVQVPYLVELIALHLDSEKYAEITRIQDTITGVLRS